ncbi:MAG: TRAP transporter large permease [Oscillibacter sp.]|jgi:C4-dicarboxylate transporter DctM subunit|nr:TRAP transporter large permease [Oscillibacter sp.]
MTGILLFGSFFVFLILGVPICVSLGLSSVIGLLIGGFDLSMLPSTISASVCKYALLAVPFFVLAGSIMEYAGISEKLIKLADACVGHRKSGLISVVVITSCFFAAISGSGAAAVAALGGILIPAMADAKYDKGLASVLVSASGAIGIIIPPSIGYVVYASIVNVSVSDLFLAGIVPGIILGIMYIIVAVIMSRNNHEIIRRDKASGREKWVAFKDAIWGLLMPVIILGGIYGGIFTPTEAAGVAVIYGLFVGIFVYKKITRKNILTVLKNAAVSSAAVMYVVACASVFAWILSTSHVATDLSELLLAITGNKIVLLLLVNLIFLIAGCFLDGTSAYYIFLPVVLPILQALNIDLVQAGIFITVNLAIGLVTPPIGINLFVGSGISKIPVSKLINKVIPFVVGGVVVLFLLTFVPQLSVGILHLFG